MNVNYYFSTIALFLGVYIMETNSDTFPDLGLEHYDIYAGFFKEADQMDGPATTITTTGSETDHWSNLERRYPYDIAVLDALRSRDLKSGVILYVDIGQWGIKEVAESSTKTRQKFVRYTSKIMADLKNKGKNWASRSRRRSRDTPKFYIVLNLENFKEEEHGCFECVWLLREIVQIVQYDWVESMEGVFLVKATNLPGYVSEWITDFVKEAEIPVRVQREGMSLESSQNGRINKISVGLFNNIIRSATFSEVNERDLERRYC